MAVYTFRKDKNGGLIRYRNGEYDGIARNPEFQLWQHLEEALDAISGITPWLAASLEEDCCETYQKACNICFDVDLSNQDRFYNMIYENDKIKLKDF